MLKHVDRDPNQRRRAQTCLSVSLHQLLGALIIGSPCATWCCHSSKGTDPEDTRATRNEDWMHMLLKGGPMEYPIWSSGLIVPHRLKYSGAI